MSDILKNYGGFNLHISDVPQITVKKLDLFYYELNFNLHPKDNPFNTTAMIYFDEHFLMETGKTLIKLSNPELVRLYIARRIVRITFVAKRIKNRQVAYSQPTYLKEHCMIIGGGLLCSETAICTNTSAEALAKIKEEEALLNG